MFVRLAEGPRKPGGRSGGRRFGTKKTADTDGVLLRKRQLSLKDVLIIIIDHEMET